MAKRITIFAGHYGSGKTNIAVNFAFQLKRTKEKVAIDSVCGHGGFFKAPIVGQSAMSAAVGAPVTVMSNAGEGGAWGIAVLALFCLDGGRDLEKFLDRIFENAERSTVSASDGEIRAFGEFMVKYKKCLAAQKLISEEL